MTVLVGHSCVMKQSMLLETLGITTICREYTSARDSKECQLVGIIYDNTVIGPP